MPSDSQDPPRKILTVAKAASSTEDASKRKRTGARARLAAQVERAKENARRRAGPQEASGSDQDRAARGPKTGGGKRPQSPSGGGSRTAPGSAAQRAPRAPRTPRAESSTERRTPKPERGTETDYRRNQPSRAVESAPAIEPQADTAERYTVFAPCPQGLEHALTAEMQALGFADAQAGRAGCRFSADWTGVQQANLYSRLATRILVQVAHAPIRSEDDILELARATPWERWFGPEHTLRVDTSAIRSPLQSLQFCNLRAKDGICDRLREYEGARPSIDTVRPDARVHLFLSADTATLYLDTSGESLFKRGWRLDKGEAPLRENLAAGMLALAGWDPAAALLDPFCGSGTILIEAAWIAMGIPPGIARPLGFERLREHDARAWQDLKDEAESRINPQLDEPLVGYDLDPAAIEFAKNNAQRALLAEDAIRFEVGDARLVEAPAARGWIVTNPPYGDRMPLEDGEALWSDWASNLKRQFGGWDLNVITSDMSLPQQLRLKPQRRTPVYNGALDCRLFGFELVTAGFRDK